MGIIFYRKSVETTTVFFGIILGLIVFFFAALFSRLNIDVHHQGIMFSAAMRVFNGLPLYIGNSYYYGPLVPILNAFGIFIFGKHLLVLQLMASACYGVIAILLWRIWARFLPGWLSGITVLFSFLLAPFLYWEFHPWSSIYSLLFLLLSLYFTIKWIETKKYGLLILVGFFAALAFLSRQTVGLALGLILLLVIIISSASFHENKAPRIKSSLFYLSGFISPLLLGGVVLFANNSLLAWFDASFSSRLDWAINISGEGAGLYQILRTVISSLFAFFHPSIWMFLPVVIVLAFIGIIVKVIRVGLFQTEFKIYITYIALCFVSWLQYYPVSEPRHHFWSALPMCAIPVIFLWRVYGQKLNPVNGISLSTYSKLVKTLWWGISGLILMSFSLTYFIEVKQRLLSGIQIDASLRLLPAWERLSVYDTPFVNPPALRGMLGTKSQVDSMSRLHNKISAYIVAHPSAMLKSYSSWDYLAANYLEHVVPNNSPPLLLNDTPLRPEGYRLLAHETIAPAFAYQLAQPGQYYLYSPIDYYSSQVAAKYHLIEPHENLVKGLDNFPSTVQLAEIQIELKKSVNLDSVSILAVGGLGTWTTSPINHLWGVGIIDQVGLGKIINKGARTEKLSLAINRKLTLLIPDNGNLSNCPELKVDLLIDGSIHLGALATCSRNVK